jgi:hypothetical protein
LNPKRAKKGRKRPQNEKDPLGNYQKCHFFHFRSGNSDKKGEKHEKTPFLGAKRAKNRPLKALPELPLFSFP